MAPSTSLRVRRALCAAWIAAASLGCSGSVKIDGSAGASPTSTASTTGGPSSSPTSVPSTGGSGGAATTTSTTSTGGSGGTVTTSSSNPPPCDPAAVDHDPDHCGACGHGCLGGECLSGACQPVLLRSEGGSPWDIALDLDHVYWLNGSGTVQRMTKQGVGAAVLRSGLFNVSQIAVDGGMVFWSLHGPDIAAEGMPTSGGTVVAYGNMGIGAGALALDATYVYWSITDASWSSITLMKTPRAGGPMTPVVPAPVRAGSVATDGGYLYWVESTSTAETPVPTKVGGLRRALANVGPVESLVTSHDIGSLAFDNSHVYWVYAGTYASPWWTGGEIRRMPKSGGAPETVVALPSNANEIAVDDHDVYWVSSDGLAVQKVSKTGGPIVTLASGGNPKAIALDDVAVYWVDPTLGTVSKVAK